MSLGGAKIRKLNLNCHNEFKQERVWQKQETKCLQNIKSGYAFVLNDLFSSNFIKSERDRQRNVSIRQRKARDIRENSAYTEKECKSNTSGLRRITSTSRVHISARTKPKSNFQTKTEPHLKKPPILTLEMYLDIKSSCLSVSKAEKNGTSQLLRDRKSDFAKQNDRVEQLRKNRSFQSADKTYNKENVIHKYSKKEGEYLKSIGEMPENGVA